MSTIDIIPEGYTRISEILGMFQAYGYVPREKLKKAIDIGTDVHDAIECYNNGDMKLLDSARFPYFQSFLAWAKLNPYKVILSERRLFDAQSKITGRIDLFAEINGETVLIDFKTGSWAHPEIWKLQGCYYRNLLEVDWLQNDGPEMPNRFLFLQLQKDGSFPKIFNFIYEDGDYDMTQNALNCYRWFKSHETQNSRGFDINTGLVVE